MAADRVDFVDEDDARRVLLALLEEVTDARRADADEHLDEIRSADREERHVGSLASPATARASSVLPVPGDPTRSTPFGIRPPSRWNFCGSRRNSTISWSSSFASSAPATSLNVTFFCVDDESFARLLPNDRALFPPLCICRMMKIQKPTMRRIGAQFSRIVVQGLAPSGFAWIVTPVPLAALFVRSLTRFW
jgi:hypothetical protein